MYIKILTNAGITMFLLLFTLTNSIAQEGCDAYPYIKGETKIEETDTGPKIIATGAAEVDFDDRGELFDALMEAELGAKAVISEFLFETIQSEKGIDSVATKTINLMKGEGDQKKTAAKGEIKTILEQLAGKSEGLLRGVVKLSECYTKGDYDMVSVGLKPETIAAAANLERSIRESDNPQPNTTSTDSSQGNSTEDPDSYIRGTENLDDF